MSDEIRILMLEDTPEDAELIEMSLREAGVTFVAQRVQTRDGFIAALAGFQPDIVLSDYRLPAFDGRAALDIVREQCPEIPVVMVTGAMGDEMAVELLKAGARDYVLKDRLARLPAALLRALAEERESRNRKAAERALRDSEEKFRAMSASAQDAVILVDNDGRVSFWNAAAGRIFGYSDEEVRGRSLHSMIVPERFRAAVEQGFGQFREFGTGAMIGNTVEAIAVRKDGSEFPVEISVSAVLLDERWNAIGIARDITSRKRMLQELQELNANLEQRVAEELDKNRAKDYLLIQQTRLAAMGEMAHNLAHQWRQPLAALAFILGNIKDDYESHELSADALSESIGNAHRILQGLSATIDDFRDLFQPDHVPAAFEIGEAVERALAIVEASLRSEEIAVTKCLPAQLYALGYANQFSQVILNILVNAKEAIQQRKVRQGCIDIRLGVLEGMAQLTIEDNGGGVPEDLLPKIFDPYFTTKEQSSGLGLYMAKMIIEHHLNGAISLVNSPRGTLVTVLLPSPGAPPPTGDGRQVSGGDSEARPRRDSAPFVPTEDALHTGDVTP